MGVLVSPSTPQTRSVINYCYAGREIIVSETPSEQDPKYDPSGSYRNPAHKPKVFGHIFVGFREFECS